MKTIQSTLILLPALIFLLLGCSKEIQNNRKLDGKWTIVDLYVHSSIGLKTKVSHKESTLQFQSDGKRTKSGEFHFNISFTYQDSLITINNSGRYNIENETELTFTSNEDPLIFKSGIFVYATKDDLMLDIGQNFTLRCMITLKKR